ncbi:transcriptional regulator, HxlR family [mine drainage metagenome]|uniref:Transcriptional regulator, HxlR family n=1 Tax=mine drainage metagenome TaxID=410659 RepID=T0ZMF8_9ZZZZ
MNKSRDCAPANIAHLMGRKWFFPVIEEIALSKDGIGFNEILRRVKYITPRDLVFLLNRMREYSLLSLKPSKGKHDLYAATKQGLGLYNVIEELKGMYPYGPSSNSKESCKGVKCTSCKWYSNDYWTSGSSKRALQATALKPAV